MDRQIEVKNIYNGTDRSQSIDYSLNSLTAGRQLSRNLGEIENECFPTWTFSSGYSRLKSNRENASESSAR